MQIKALSSLEIDVSPLEACLVFGPAADAAWSVVSERWFDGQMWQAPFSAGRSEISIFMLDRWACLVYYQFSELRGSGKDDRDSRGAAL